MMLGVDVSNNQGAIPWDAVAAQGVQFAIAKASEGDNFHDDWLAHNFAEMRRLSILRGSYHFARPSRCGAVQEAEQYLRCIDAVAEPGDVLALDLEDDKVPVGQSLLDWTLTWLRHVEERVGCKPLLYVGRSYLKEHGLLGHSELAEWLLWLAWWPYAQPPAEDFKPPIPLPWPDLTVWQYSAHGLIAGVEFDLNRFYGTPDDWRALGKPGVVTPPVDSMRPSLRDLLVTVQANAHGYAQELNTPWAVSATRLSTIVKELEEWSTLATKELEGAK